MDREEDWYYATKVEEPLRVVSPCSLPWREQKNKISLLHICALLQYATTTGSMKENEISCLL